MIKKLATYVLLPTYQQQSTRGRGTPGRTWEVVDASYYGGRGAGGIRPMTVSSGINLSLTTIPSN